MGNSIAPAADFYPDPSYGPATAAVQSWERSRAAREHAPAAATFRAPAAPPCDFRAAHAMLYLFDQGLDADFAPVGRYARAALTWQVRAALDTLAGTRFALLPDNRSRCAINVSAAWEVIA